MNKKDQIIEVVPYNSNWILEFEAETSQIKPLFAGNFIAIHHIGSTAVPGLSAKPTIDIILEVKNINLVDECNNAMAGLGYEAWGENGIMGRRLFLKGEEKRTHHVHTFQTGHTEIYRHLCFRDYLIAHPEEARNYAELKIRLATQFSNNRMAYVENKQDYIKRLEQKVLKWYNNIYNHFAFSTKANNPLFYLDDGTSLTYSAVDKKVANYCNYFASLNLKSGDRIAAQTEKSVDALCIYLASLRYGTIYIPLNPAFQLEELAYFIEDAEPSLFVCSPDKKHALHELKQQKNLSLIIETLSENEIFSIHNKVKFLSSSFDTVAKHADEIAAILYTSGTTGKPKGAMLSHANLLTNGVDLVQAWGFNQTDTLLHMLPIFHCHGLFFASHCVLLSGASMIFLPKLDINLAIKYLPQSTVFMGVPTYYNRLLADERFTPKLVSNVRLFISGSAPLSENTFYAFEQKIGQKILERYGMTETGINTANPLNGDRIVNSTGIPLASVTVRVVDNQDNEVAINQPGQIQVKGTNVFKGYWKKEDKTSESFTPDGYFKTGDIGKQDEQGYISIIGRDKDMIISGGINVYPKEIEDLINIIPGVKESAVIGLPHPDFGEAVTAIIVADATASLTDKEIIDLVKSKIANYKVPKQVVIVDALPRNTMAKVQKNILRDKYKTLYD